MRCVMDILASVSVIVAALSGSNFYHTVNIPAADLSPMPWFGGSSVRMRLALRFPVIRTFTLPFYFFFAFAKVGLEPIYTDCLTVRCGFF